MPRKWRTFQYMQIQYELTPADIMASQSLFQWRRSRLVSWGLTLYGVLFFLWGLLMLIAGSLSLAVVPLILGTFAATFMPVIMPRLLLKNWSKARKPNGPTTLSTSPDGVEISHSLARLSMKWEMFIDVLEGPTLWLLFIQPQFYYVIPKRAFASVADQDLFRTDLLHIEAAKQTASAPSPPLSVP